MPKKSAKKGAKEEPKPGFFSLKNRWFVYTLILIGGIMADIGVLFINSDKKIMSYSFIFIGAVLLFFSLYLIAHDRFYIPNYRRI